MGVTFDGPKQCVQDQKQKPDADFVPNLVNTVCFVVNFIIQLSTFACNYQGAPFNTPIKQTKGFFNMLKYSYIFCLVIIYDVMGIGTAFSLVSNIARLSFTSNCQLLVSRLHATSHLLSVCLQRLVLGSSAHCINTYYAILQAA